MRLLVNENFPLKSARILRAGGFNYLDNPEWRSIDLCLSLFDYLLKISLTELE